MSFDFNYKFWVATKKDISSIIQKQNALKKLEPIEKPAITFKIFSELYVLYVELVNKLGYLYSKTFQVQKRAVIRTLVESATRRLLELKNELKNLEFSEYVYTDKALITRKLTPYDIFIWRSPEFLYKRPMEFQNLVYDNTMFMDDDKKVEQGLEEHNKLEEAVILIQTHERARKARVYLAAIKYDKKYLKVVKQREVKYSFTHKADQQMSIPVKKTIFSANYIKALASCEYLLDANHIGSKSTENLEKLAEIWNRAATIIQRAWRAYKMKKIDKKKSILKQELYGMKIKRRLLKPHKYFDAIAQAYNDEKLKQKLDEDFLNLITDERTRLLQERAPWIMEDISDHIRAWFREFFDLTGAFHPYPEEIKSGTVLVLIDETMTPMEYQTKMNEKGLSAAEKKKRAEKEKLLKEKQKEKRKKEKMKEAKRRKKMKLAGIFDIAETIKKNANLAKMEETMKRYSLDWKFVDEYLNKNHEPIKDWVTESELAIIHKELRALVDQFMRIEHELLNKALAADNKKKYKPPKERKGKKGKGKRKKKKKKGKDMTADRTLESLFNELKESGIIEKCPTKRFDDFIGEVNFVADDVRDEHNLTTLEPAKGDIKLVIQEAMLGMGQFVIDKPKSILIFGPLNSGKKLLCNIIATEIDAVFMNLSPEKTVQYEENINYFLHVVMKVAKAFQPTILFIEDVHRVFWKKIPKEQEDLNPRLLKRPFMKKILKPIRKDDKIMVLGTSETPWAAARLKKYFPKILLLPSNDYGTSFLIWLEMLDMHLGDDNVDDYVVSSLAKVLQKYISGDVTDNITEILNVHRKMRLKAAPVKASEFLEHFIADELQPKFPPETKLNDKYTKWFAKSNKLAIQRRKYLAALKGKLQKKK